MEKQISTPPLYDRRRLEMLVNAHKLQVHLKQKKDKQIANAGVKAPR